jgi:uncharacterized protein YcgI (DUF1989 family)
MNAAAATDPVPGRRLVDRVVPPGGDWSGIVRRGQVLRIVDLEGRQAVDFLCYSAADPSERYSAADSVKVAGSIFLTTGHGLYSDMGRRLFTSLSAIPPSCTTRRRQKGQYKPLNRARRTGPSARWSARRRGPSRGRRPA